MQLGDTMDIHSYVAPLNGHHTILVVLVILAWESAQWIWRQVTR